MIGEDLRRNTLAWYSCPDRCINARLHPEDHQLRLENFYAPSFPQMGHWNSVLCSHLNLDTIPYHIKYSVGAGIKDTCHYSMINFCKALVSPKYKVLNWSLGGQEVILTG